MAKTKGIREPKDRPGPNSRFLFLQERETSFQNRHKIRNTGFLDAALRQVKIFNLLHSALNRQNGGKTGIPDGVAKEAQLFEGFPETAQGRDCGKMFQALYGFSILEGNILFSKVENKNCYKLQGLCCSARGRWCANVRWLREIHRSVSHPYPIFVKKNY